MVDHVIEALAGDGDGERVHVGEVGRGEVAGLVNLAEHDGLPGSMGGPPLSHAPLEGATVRIEEPPRVFASQPVEERLGEQSRLGLEPLLDPRPHGGERIGPGAVGPRPARLPAGAWRRGVVAIVSGRLVGHSGSPGRGGQGCSCIEFAQQSVNLAVRDHRISPRLRETRSWPAGRKQGILIVAGKGKLNDATQTSVL